MKAYRIILNLFKNPIFTFVSGVLISLLFFILSREYVSPRYSVNGPETIAESSSEAEDLVFFWNNKKIIDIKKVKIAIWNDGLKYMDSSNISKVEPIEIVIPKGISVLSHKITSTSRATLEFDTELSKKPDTNSVIKVYLKNDDAIEKYEGLAIDILFTGNGEDDFYVRGRIKGAPEGFQKIEWNKIKPIFDDIVEIRIFYIFSLFFIFNILSILANKSNSLFFKRSVVSFIFFEMWLSINSVFLGIIVLSYAVNFVNRFYYSIEWIT